MPNQTDNNPETQSRYKKCASSHELPVSIRVGLFYHQSRLISAQEKILALPSGDLFLSPRGIVRSSFDSSLMIFSRKKRWPYFLAMVLIIPIGLLIRNFEDALGWLGLHGPDALYATLIFWGFRWLSPSRSPWLAAGGCLLFCFGIEFLQLYKAPWIGQVRATRIGGLILGHGFLWVDLCRYTAGVGLGLLGEKWQQQETT